MTDKLSDWQQKARTEMQAEWQALQRLRERAAGGNVADEDCNILNRALRDYATLKQRVEGLDELIKQAPKHEADYKGVDCPYGGPGPWDHNECDCGYWGRLEDWAKALAEEET